MNIDTVELAQVGRADGGIRNGKAREAGVLGLAESVKSISKEIEDRVFSVMNGLHRTRSLLRLMKTSMEVRGYNLGSDEVVEIAVLIETALDTLPHHDEDLYDPVDESLCRLRKEHDAQVKVTHALNDVVRAMAVAAQPDVTVAELEDVTRVVHALACENEAYVPDWEVLRDAIRRRGFRVIDDGIDQVPSVVSSEMVRKAEANLKRIVEEMFVEGDGAESSRPSDSGRRRKVAKGKKHAA